MGRSVYRGGLFNWSDILNHSSTLSCTLTKVCVYLNHNNNDLMKFTIIPHSGTKSADTRRNQVLRTLKEFDPLTDYSKASTNFAWAKLEEIAKKLNSSPEALVLSRNTL